MGTAAYMSPEQVSGQPVDQRSDLFSFGIVLHEMLSGRAPFTAPTPVETMTAVLRADPPPLPVFEGSTGSGLERCVRHCLEKSPDARFQSARDSRVRARGARADGRVRGRERRWTAECSGRDTAAGSIRAPGTVPGCRGG